MSPAASIRAALRWAAVTLALCASLAAAQPAPANAVAAPKPPIVEKLVPFGAARHAQMAAYSRHHYHQDTSWLTAPKVIVLHYTAGSSWLSAWNTFASNAAYNGEKPGVSAHFIIRKDGVIIQCVRLSTRARHAIGMNWKSIGIEFVQEGSGRSADRAILARKAQVRAGLRLVRWLQARYDIKTKNVIGHAMANGSPFFKDYTGAKNHALDWQAPDVHTFRGRL
jgi:N-acetyl-anhydromuramyl-L-alanine amidase AmpD